MGHDNESIRKVIRKSSGKTDGAGSPSANTFPYAPRRGARGNGCGSPGNRPDEIPPWKSSGKSGSPDSHPDTSGRNERFAGWLAGASAEQVERFKLQGERRLTPEQMELHRLCGERILKEHATRGRKFTAEVLADARRWAAFPKLHGALTSGEPLHVALRGDNLEVF